MDFTIQTERLKLRPPELSDSEELFQLMEDSRLTKFLTWEPHPSIETTTGLLNGLINAQENDEGYHWCVCLENEIIGLVSLIDVRRTIRTWTLNRSELSYWISSKHQGKGYATEASKAVIEYGFQKLSFHKIIIAHAEKNIKSKRICEKLGFTQYAHEQDAFQKNGEWNNLLWYERINR